MFLFSNKHLTWEKVVFYKPDLDTTLTAFLAGVTTDCTFEVSPHADKLDINNPDVLCIECGGSGLVELHNFDHHGGNCYLPPACRQAYTHFGYEDYRIAKLVEYVSAVDEAVKLCVTAPSLSNIFSGMLLTVHDPLEQLIKGIDIIHTVLSDNINPFEMIEIKPQWRIYVEAKDENQLHLDRDLKNLVFFKTNSGIPGGLLVTTAIGGSGMLYKRGCEVCVLYNPNKNKFTVASKKHDLSAVLKYLQHTESGWGGRPNIFGSPHRGTNLSVRDVISIVMEVL
ncbi:MAG: hypothetical protein D6726_03250 [Nitrospirae bacterium]|nr:MAG: hypothetical protein D6726_03250 [Nitrospirota bacterium]